jgi:hypothetical protein
MFITYHGEFLQENPYQVFREPCWMLEHSVLYPSVECVAVCGAHRILLLGV